MATATALHPIPATTAPASSGVPPWLAIWTRSRHESHVRNQLAAKGLETFLPTATRWSQWKDRRKRIDWPLFPGYCFVRLDPTDTRLATSCPGVVSFVGFDGRPAAIADREIDAVRRLVESELRLDPCPFIHEGDMVEVAGGPLRGVVGRLTRKGSNARLIVAVGLLGQGVTVDVDAADVRPY